MAKFNPCLFENRSCYCGNERGDAKARRKIDPIPGTGAPFVEAWCFAFFGGSAGSGAIMVVPSGGPADVVPTTVGASVSDGSATGVETADVAGVEAVAATAAALAADAAGAGAGAIGLAAIGGVAGLSTLSLEGAAVTVADNAGFAIVAAGVAVVIGAAAIAGAADGTAAAWTLVTMARAAIGAVCGSLGRSISVSTTPAPAVAPIAVATRTTRAVRAKLGAGAK